MTTRTGPHTPGPPGSRPAGHAGHGWMMIACCIPMLAIALAAAGVLSGGFLIAALACTAMMALMMRGMDHTGHDSPPTTTAGREPPVTKEP